MLVKRVQITDTLALRCKRVDGEYQVAVMENGMEQHRATYFTDDKQDALATMADMQSRIEAKLAERVAR